MTKSEQRIIPRLVAAIRRKGYSYATEKTYAYWNKRFLRFHRFKREDEIETRHIEPFLTHLAANLRVAPSTQNQAVNAVVFLFREVLKEEPGDFSSFQRAKKAKLLPVVLSREEITAILSNLIKLENPTYVLMVGLLYGCWLRLRECLELRIKDVDFEQDQVWVRHGKGAKDRVIALPQTIKEPLSLHLEKVREIHQKELREGFGSVYLPHALGRKYPKAPLEWDWQYVFPAHRRSRDPRSGIVRRHHLHQSVLIRHIKKAKVKAGITKKLSTHSFRHSYASHSLEDGKDVRTLQQLLGHESIKTTMIYLHLANIPGKEARSPLDAIFPATVQEKVTACALGETDGRLEAKDFEQKPLRPHLDIGDPLPILRPQESSSEKVKNTVWRFLRSVLKWAFPGSPQRQVKPTSNPISLSDSQETRVRKDLERGLSRETASAQEAVNAG